MAAIAQRRAANINECTAVGERHRPARDLISAHRGNDANHHRNIGAVSARGYSINEVRDRAAAGCRANLVSNDRNRTSAAG
jgi:hypothetical protein